MSVSRQKIVEKTVALALREHHHGESQVNDVDWSALVEAPAVPRRGWQRKLA